PQGQNYYDSKHSSTHGAAPLEDYYHFSMADTATQTKKGAPAPLPHSEEDCPNAPLAPIPGAMRQPVRIVPALDPISCASRAGQSHQYYTVHEALYRVKFLTFPILAWHMWYV